MKITVKLEAVTTLMEAMRNVEAPLYAINDFVSAFHVEVHHTINNSVNVSDTGYKATNILKSALLRFDAEAALLFFSSYFPKEGMTVKSEYNHDIGTLEHTVTSAYTVDGQAHIMVGEVQLSIAEAIVSVVLCHLYHEEKQKCQKS